MPTGRRGVSGAQGRLRVEAKDDLSGAEIPAFRREQPRRIRIHSIQPGLVVATEWLAYALGWGAQARQTRASTSLGIDPSRVAEQPSAPAR